MAQARLSLFDDIFALSEKSIAFWFTAKYDYMFGISGSKTKTNVLERGCAYLWFSSMRNFCSCTIAVVE